MKKRVAGSGWRVGILVLLTLCVAGAVFAQQQNALKVPDAENFVGKPQGTRLVTPELDRVTQEVAGTIRCPVCQGLSIADSPSEMAINMKSQVRELLARGYTREQILSYFERSYGQFVLLKPKFQGVNSLVWILPIAALAIGVLIVFTKMRNLGAEPVKSAQSVPPAEDEVQDPYLAQVRDLVKGDR